MRHHHLLFAAIGLCAIQGTLLTDSPAGQSPFAQVVLREFDKWDKKHEGRLTFDVVEWWTRNPSLRGEEAAAMAMLHRVLRKETAAAAAHRESHIPDFTRTYFEHYNQMTAKERQSHYAFDVYFLAAKVKIAKESRELFPEGMPKLSTIHQGNIGDCHFLGPLGSMVFTRPGQVKEMIGGDQEHGYSVRFPSRPSVKITPLTDTELGLLSSAGSNGIWLAVLEKARGEVHREGSHMNTRDDVDALAASPEKTRIDIELLTGHRPERLVIPNPSKAPRKFAQAKRKLRDLLARMDRDKHLCAAASRDPNYVPAPAGMAGDHSYAVLGYDRSNDVVHVWNPWGNSFTPRGGEGIKAGYETLHGAFKMPLKDFAREFSVVCHESSEPVRQLPR